MDKCFVKPLYLTSNQPANVPTLVVRLAGCHTGYVRYNFLYELTYEELKWGGRVMDLSGKAFRSRIRSDYMLHWELTVCLSFVMVIVTHYGHFYISVAFHVCWMAFAFGWDVEKALEDFASCILLWNSIYQTVKLHSYNWRNTVSTLYMIQGITYLPVGTSYWSYSPTRECETRFVCTYLNKKLT